jgi:hypothetical protein
MKNDQDKGTVPVKINSLLSLVVILFIELVDCLTCLLDKLMLLLLTFSISFGNKFLLLFTPLLDDLRFNIWDGAGVDECLKSEYFTNQ